MKKLLLRVCRFLPILIGMGVLTYGIDVNNYFLWPSYLTGMAEILQKKENVTCMPTYDDRLFQAACARLRHKPPAILVVGSSRVMEIGSDIFPHSDLINAGVTAGGIRDVLAMHHLYTQHGLPDTVIIGIDPWLVDAAHSDLWESVQDHYIATAKHLGIADTRRRARRYLKELRAYKALLSPTYGQQCFSFLLQYGTDKYHSVGHSLPLTRGGRLADNTLFYPHEFRTQTPAHVSATLRTFLRSPHDWYKDKSEAYVQMFEQYVDYLLQHNVQVMLFVSPIHPLVYTSPLVSVAALDAHQAYVTRFAAARGLRVVGDLNPAVAGVDSTDFYDYGHCRRPTLVRLFQRSGLSPAHL
jgi:hypothetical protein